MEGWAVGAMGTRLGHKYISPLTHLHSDICQCSHHRDYNTHLGYSWRCRLSASWVCVSSGS